MVRLIIHPMPEIHMASHRHDEFVYYLCRLREEYGGAAAGGRPAAPPLGVEGVGVAATLVVAFVEDGLPFVGRSQLRRREGHLRLATLGAGLVDLAGERGEGQSGRRAGKPVFARNACVSVSCVCVSCVCGSDRAAATGSEKALSARGVAPPTHRGVLVPHGLLGVKLGLLEGKLARLRRAHCVQELCRGQEAAGVSSGGAMRSPLSLPVDWPLGTRACGVAWALADAPWQESEDSTASLASLSVACSALLLSLAADARLLLLSLLRKGGSVHGASLPLSPCQPQASRPFSSPRASSSLLSFSLFSLCPAAARSRRTSNGLPCAAPHAANVLAVGDGAREKRAARAAEVGRPRLEGLAHPHCLCPSLSRLLSLSLPLCGRARAGGVCSARCGERVLLRA